MRYLIAMAVAIVAALLVTLFVSPPLADLVVDRFTFESPDEVADLHSAVYMLSNLVALLIGWIVGWIVGGRLVSRAPVA
jgi:hypothetical protein